MQCNQRSIKDLSLSLVIMSSHWSSCTLMYSHLLNIHFRTIFSMYIMSIMLLCHLDMYVSLLQVEIPSQNFHHQESKRETDMCNPTDAIASKNTLYLKTEIFYWQKELTVRLKVLDYQFRLLHPGGHCQWQWLIDCWLVVASGAEEDAEDYWQEDESVEHSKKCNQKEYLN